MRAEASSQGHPSWCLTFTSNRDFFHTKHRRQLCDFLHSKVDVVMHLAHSHPPGGHLATRNTTEKVWDRFLWLAMNAESQNFCQ